MAQTIPGTVSAESRTKRTFLKNPVVPWTAFLFCLMGIQICRAGDVAIVCLPSGECESLAARELKKSLESMFVGEHVAVSSSLPDTGRTILLGIVRNNPRLSALLTGNIPASPESFTIQTKKERNRELILIAGVDEWGLFYGVYRFLEQLGAGFYLSQDILPRRDTELIFRDWNLRDEPLVRDRIVMNWHNFLSSCSAWNLSDWQRWIDQSQKQGYNGIMIHLYGNNPIFRFSFRGEEKPLGYLTTTVKGRDWSTQHVLDVRRMWGGFAFDKPVFGSDAAMVSDESRADAAVHLMSDVFSYAGRRAMNINLAIDVDTEPANPQNLILKLDPADRFAVQAKKIPWMNQTGGTFWLANPDTPGGYAFYLAQVQALLRDYPQLRGLVLWFRQQDTPWVGMKAGEMPLDWQSQVREASQNKPVLAKMWKPHNSFALSRIAAAFRRAMNDLGRSDISLSMGSWKFDFLDGCDAFLPPHIPLIGLDSEILKDRSILSDSAAREKIARIAEHRPGIPFFWAHHDDGAYLGRPYVPPNHFTDRLNEMSARGFGIIHWTTRPLDLYFKSLSRQVWLSTRNEPLPETCNQMAEHFFGSACRSPMGSYLQNWITEGPILARETSVQFIDKKLTDEAIEKIIHGCKTRLEDLGSIQSCLTGDPRPQRDFRYFQGLEQSIQDICHHEEMLRRAKALQKEGKPAEAISMMRKCHEGEVIERFAKTCVDAGITPGEQGLIVSMNLRWLPHFVRLRQSLGMEPVRFRFAPTSHEPLALARGVFTFFFDEHRNLWECLGSQETGLPVHQFPCEESPSFSGSAGPYLSVISSGIRCEKEFTLPLKPILDPGRMEDPDDLEPLQFPAGKYRLTLIFRNSDSKSPCKEVLELKISPPMDRRNPCRMELAQNEDISMFELPVELPLEEIASVAFRPLSGTPILCAAILWAP